MTGKIVRWALLIPVVPLSIVLSWMGWMGFGFGAGIYTVAYLLAFPAFFLNLISAKWGMIGASLLVAIHYILAVFLNWPILNPLVLFNSDADLIFFIMIGFTIASGLISMIIHTKSEARELNAD